MGTDSMSRRSWTCGIQHRDTATRPHFVIAIFAVSRGFMAKPQASSGSAHDGEASMARRQPALCGTGNRVDVYSDSQYCWPA